MVKLIDIVKKLKSDYEARQKKIDDIIDNTNNMVIAHTEAMRETKILMVRLQLDLEDLSDDYKSIKKKVDIKFKELSKNPWLRLFGVK